MHFNAPFAGKNVISKPRESKLSIVNTAIHTIAAGPIAICIVTPLLLTVYCSVVTTIKLQQTHAVLL